MMIPFHKFIIFQLGISNFKACLFVVVPYSHTEIVPSRICCSICFNYTGYCWSWNHDEQCHYSRRWRPLAVEKWYLRKCTLDPGLIIDTKYCFPFSFLDSKYNWSFNHATNEILLVVWCNPFIFKQFDFKHVPMAHAP